MAVNKRRVLSQDVGEHCDEKKKDIGKISEVCIYRRYVSDVTNEFISVEGISNLQYLFISGIYNFKWSIKNMHSFDFDK